MAKKLPIKLKKEPLLDVVFEIRFSSPPPTGILPGIFFEKLKGEKLVEQTTAAEVPKQIRNADPNLQYAPIIRILWKEFILLIGERNVALGCKIPYAGWDKFKETIIKIIRILVDSGTIQSIDRYSLKYVDLIQNKDLRDQIKSVNLSICLGDHHLEKESIQFRIEFEQDEFINVVSIISNATAISQDQKTKWNGLVIDVDTVCNVKNQKFEVFTSDLEEKLDKIHHVNKIMFFSCITPATLDALEPIYE